MNKLEIKKEILNLIEEEENFNKNFGINTKVNLLNIYARLNSKIRCAVTDLVMKALKNVESYKYGHTKRQLNQGILKVMNEIITQV